MKTIIALFSLIIYSTITFASDPIPGLDVKVGRKPPGEGQIIENIITDKYGSFEIKNLTAGKYSYYLDFAFKQTGTRGFAPPGPGFAPPGSGMITYALVQVDNIKLLSCTKGKTKAAPAPIVDRFSINISDYGQVNLTIIYDCNSIKGSLEMFDPNQRSLPFYTNTSRSNIKIIKQ